MSANVQRTAQLGDLIAAAFDGASAYSADPNEVLRLAAGAVGQMLRRAAKTIPVAKGQRHACMPSPTGGHRS